jgi:hypothetical protein
MGIYVCLEYAGLDLNKFPDEIWWGTDDAKKMKVTQYYVHKFCWLEDIT